ncbi:Ig domain-containing protein [Roseobacter sp. S98]|uniref:Ig domain-containing protein n=1 Tax=Roseobacter algicola (ex Choi et al. 2025) (nom. illeg.) TaxID=3092138 RepID=UPI003F51125B
MQRQFVLAGLNVLGGRPGGVRTPFTPPSFSLTALQLPAGQLQGGQTAQADLTGLVVFMSLSNYVSTAGTISSVDYQINGTAAPTDTVLSEGDVLRFVVTDSAGNTQSFSLPDVTAAVIAAPVAAGAVADQLYVTDDPVTGPDVAADFTGDAVLYALAPSSGALPAGLSLTSAGLITGTPTAPGGPVTVIVRGTNAGGFADSAFEITVAAYEITATLPPASSPLYEGQSISDMSGYAAMTDVANFSVNAGDLVSAVASVTGDALSDTAPLTAGDQAGFSVMVTGTAGSPVSFSTALQTVEPVLTITDSGTSQAVLTLSALPDDSVPVPATTIEIDGVIHTLPAGTTCGDLRSSAVQMERDSPVLTSTGDPAAFAEGDVLTLADTIWLSTDMLSFSVVVSNSGGVVQSGTDRSYTVTATDVADGTLSLREVANNGTTSFDGETSAATAAATGISFATLFGSGEAGVVVMPGTADTICYTETTGAAAITVCGDGDPVGTIHDTVNDVYLTAPNTANRATYRVNGNRAYFSKSAGAQYYVSTAPVDLSGSDRASALIALERPGSDTTFRYIAGLGNNNTSGGVNFSKSSTARRYLAYHRGAGVGSAIAAATGSSPGSSSGSLPNVAANDVLRMQSDISADAVTIWANGVEYETDSRNAGSGNLASANINFLSNPSSASNGYRDNVYGYVLINRHLTAQEATALEAGMQDQIGGA